VAYGKEQPAKIAELIKRYEGMQDRKRTEYPYAR
ncbi:MAG: hypothetical protein QOJ65_2715, partial [Fimbriimonadaceae bacterium]|nr:hypothetical protein [Fimbriimonadaceae bacterium]